MSKKKKVSRGNPAAVTVGKAQKPRGVWKPSSSLNNAGGASKAVRSRKRFDMKKAFMVFGAILLAGVFVVTTVLATVPILPEEETPYNVPGVVQNK